MLFHCHKLTTFAYFLFVIFVGVSGFAFSLAIFLAEISFHNSRIEKIYRGVCVVVASFKFLLLEPPFWRFQQKSLMAKGWGIGWREKGFSLIYKMKYLNIFHRRPKVERDDLTFPKLDSRLKYFASAWANISNFLNGNFY